MEGTRLRIPCPSPSACPDFMFVKHPLGTVHENILEDTGYPLKATPLPSLSLLRWGFSWRPVASPFQG